MVEVLYTHMYTYKYIYICIYTCGLECCGEDETGVVGGGVVGATGGGKICS